MASTSSDSLKASPFSSLTYLLPALLFLNILSLIDRNLLQSFVVDIRQDLNLSFLQFNILNGPVIDISLISAALITGSLADRYNRIYLITGALFCWSLGIMGIGLSHSFWEMVIPLAVMAAALSALTPAAISIISDLAQPQYLARSTALFYLGTPIGIGCSLLVAGIVGSLVGWRQCFILLGSFGVAASLFLPLLKDPRHRHHSSSPSLRHILSDSWQSLRSSKALTYTILGTMLVAAGQTAHNIDQAWLVQERGFSVAEGQLTFGIIMLGAGISGTILGGVIGDYIYTRHQGGRLLLLAVIGLLTVPLELLYRFYPAVDTIFYSIVFFGAMGLMMPFAPMMASISDLAPTHVKATLLAFTLIAMAIGGSVFGNIGTGLIIDYLISAGVEKPLTYGLFGIGLMPALASPLFYLAAKEAAKTP